MAIVEDRTPAVIGIDYSSSWYLICVSITVVTVGFEFEIYNATENEERVVVCVRLFEGTTEREFSVNAVVISGSTATSKSLLNFMWVWGNLYYSAFLD